jgi:hypothetical protein
VSESGVYSDSFGPAMGSFGPSKHNQFRIISFFIRKTTTFTKTALFMDMPYKSIIKLSRPVIFEYQKMEPFRFNKAPLFV